MYIYFSKYLKKFWQIISIIFYSLIDFLQVSWKFNFIFLIANVMLCRTADNDATQVKMLLIANLMLRRTADNDATQVKMLWKVNWVGAEGV